MLKEVSIAGEDDGQEEDVIADSHQLRMFSYDAGRNFGTPALSMASKIL